MTNERFNELMNGDVFHATWPLTVGRFMLALRFVVEATGELGERALERFCKEREAQDASKPEG